MRIKIEPKEFFMHAVFLAFNPNQPDPEDVEVRSYLDERELIPKAQGKQTLDGEEFDVMYFGGCYRGRHLQAMYDLQSKGVEREMLISEIERILSDTAQSETQGAADSTSEPRFKELVSRLAEEFHQESSFTPDEEGHLEVTVEPDVARQKFAEAVAAS